ncbi:phytase [Wenyingzhuangia sp. IMCC45574]
MKQTILFPILALVMFSACYRPFKQKELVFSVQAALETTPVESTEDAADDICIWIHPTNSEKSTIIGTNKQQGLCVYNLQGELMYNYPIGRVNNVDIRNNFLHKGKNTTIVTASNRTNNTISIHSINPNGTLQNIASQPIQSNLPKIYGLCMYQNKETTYVFVSGKQGGVEKWKLVATPYGVKGILENTIQIGSITEGMVADDATATIYIAEENKALWKYNAENLNAPRKLVAKTSDLNFKDDFEGVTIYKKDQNSGYIILSSQGNNSYAVFDRETNKYIKSFVIKHGNIDGTNDTDGIDVTAVNLPNYPKGIFIAQDGANTDGDLLKNQNFKIVDFRDILKELE